VDQTGERRERSKEQRARDRKAGELKFDEAGAEGKNVNLIENRPCRTQDRAVRKQRGIVEGVIDTIVRPQELLDTRGLMLERWDEYILFPEQRLECEELNNSPQIAAALKNGGLPDT